MTISPLKTNQNYFKNLNNTKLYAEYLDFKFNEIVNFVNSTIISTIGAYANEFFIGIENIGKLNAFIVNAGDTTLSWNFLTNENFANNGLSLSKFKDGNKNSVIITNSTSSEIKILEGLPNTALQVDAFNNIVFKEITGDNFEDGTIDGSNIELGTLKTDSIIGDIYAIPDNTIENDKLAVDAVTTFNLQDDSVTLNKFSLEIQSIFDVMVTSSMIPYGYFTEATNWHSIFDGNYYNKFDELLTRDEYFRIFNTNQLITDNKIVDTNVKYYDCTLGDNRNIIKPNSIDSNRLYISGKLLDGGIVGDYTVDINELFEDECIDFIHLSADFLDSMGVKL